MATPGRSLDPSWDYFTRDTTTNPKVPKAVCRGCGDAMGAIVDRMHKHIKKCASAQALFPLRFGAPVSDILGTPGAKWRKVGFLFRVLRA